MNPAVLEQTTLEAALEQTERDADAALAAATKLVGAAKAARTAARTGDLKAMRRSIEAVRDAAAKAVERGQELQDGWTWSEADEVQYLESGAYTRELLEAASRAGLSLYEQEGFLACYPSLVRIQPRERGLAIDRKAHRQIRPSRLVVHLAALQKKAPRFNAQQFLETLYGAYELTAAQKGVEKLLDIYRTLTLLPTARRDYSQQEFARDIYLLDGSGETRTKDGRRMRLHPGATGSKKRGNLLVVVTREGVERTYYGLEFI